ncbi:MAG: helix-turn-helix transcriptional regulator [Anaerolineae bacterium]|nr:helix-turn-helix transcriptional regulator [Anaerolineae bacterium]
MTDCKKVATKGDYKTYGLDCPIAKALDVIGDRWTLLIIRDLLRGNHKYQDLLESLEGISTNLLAERLARLVDEGIVTRTLYSEKPPRAAYYLTEPGKQLASVIDALFEWGVKWRQHSRSPEQQALRDYLIHELGLKPGDVRTVQPRYGRRISRV